MRQFKSTWCVLTTLLLFGCYAGDTSVAKKALQPLPPGDSLPSRVDAMLYGSAQSCNRDTECPGQVCYYGSCIGLLIVDQRWMQESIAGHLKTEVDGHEALRERVILHLARVLDRADTDLAFRARAIVPLEALNAEQPILDALNSDNERLEAAAALSLTRLRHGEGLLKTRALTEHLEPAIASEALRALGASGQKEALMPLLRTLNPMLGDMLLRAALSGLGELGDKRAIRPLVEFMNNGPDHLRHAVARALRRISGETLGAEPSRWRTWLAASNPPEAPEYGLRTVSSEAEIGIPTP